MDTVHNAEIKTAAVEIKTLTVSGNLNPLAAMRSQANRDILPTQPPSLKYLWLYELRFFDFPAERDLSIVLGSTLIGR